jgi:AcrR family transcriptional regulator
MSNPAPPIRLTRAEKRDQTRAALLTAAAQVFAARGFQATTLDAVAEAAGLTKGAVYSNFQSKDDLIQALLDDRTERDGRRWQAAFAVSDATDRLRQIANVAGESMHGDRDWIALELQFHLYALHQQTARDKLRAHYARVEDAIATALSAHLGDRPENLTSLARGLPALSFGLGIMNQLESPGQTTNQVWHDLLERLLRPR